MVSNPQANPLVAIRQQIGWPQITMAQEMGLSLRAYQALETGETPMRRIHTLAAQRVALYTAWMQMRPDFIKGQIARELIEIARDCYGLQIKPVGPDYLPLPKAGAKTP